MNMTVRWVKVGSSDLRAYERVYNADGDVTEVHVSGQPTWRYDYDADANIVRASHHDKVDLLLFLSSDTACKAQRCFVVSST